MLLISLALAHSPHDIAPFVSVAPDGTVVTALNYLLATSADAHAFDYAFLGGPHPTCAWALSADTLVTVADGDIYRSADGGLTFDIVGPAGVTGCSRDDADLRVVAGGQVWASADGLGWTASGSVGWDAVDVVSFQGVDYVRDGEGLVYRVGDGALPLDVGACRALAASDSQLVVAPADGWLLSSTDGETFTPLVNGPMDVNTVHVTGDTVLAATATEALWVSEDAGATWTLWADNLEELATGSGSPSDGVHYLDVTERDGTWYLAAWEGLFAFPPGDTHWHQGDLRSAPLVRDLTWLPGDDLLVGVYGGGVYRGVAGQSSWRDVSRGVTWLYPHRAWVHAPDWFVLTGRQVMVSPDEGATWAQTDVPVDEVGEALAVDDDYPGDDRVLASGLSGGTGHVLRATVGEWGWADTELLDCDRRPADMVLRGDIAWVGCGNRLYRSVDGGVTWTGTDDLGVEVQCLSWEDELLVGTTGGAYREVDGADGGFSVEPYAFAGASIQELAWAPDGSLWAATNSGVARSQDGVERWFGWPVLDQPQSIAIRHDGAVAVGMYDGAWWSTDQGETWTLACPWDVLDDEENSWWWSGWSVESSAVGKMFSVHVGDFGAVAEVEVEGEHLALLTASEHPVRFTVSVDGAAPVEVERPEHALSIGWVGTAEPGLHRLRVEVIEGRLQVDGVERWRASDPLTPGPGTDCGCGGGGPSSGLASALLPLLVLRRRRAGASPGERRHRRAR